MKDRNDNRQGYKKTKVGWIPEEWECVELLSIAAIKRGRFSHRPRNEPRFYGGKHPFVQTGDVSGARTYIRTFSQTLNDDGLAISKMFPMGTILMTIAANIGDCAILAFDSACPDSLVAISPNNTVINTLFLSEYLTSTKEYRRYLAPRSAQHNINVGIISKYHIPLPTLPEQKKIAEIISTWDEAIEQTRKLIEAKNHHKKALMQQLLTAKKRLPGFSEPWKEFSLGDLAAIIFSNVDKKATRDEIFVRLCNYTDVYYNDRITQHMHLMKATARNAEIAKYKLAKNDVIITKDSETAEDIAVPCYVADEVEDTICGYHLAIIRPHPALVYGPFLSYLLMADQVHYQFVRIANGVTRFGLTNGSVKRIKINIPPVNEQHHIAEVLSTADEEIAILKTKLQALEKQKRGLMQKLLTGEVRVQL